ncbi:MAG: hypothetical protein HN348_20365 [Proteobacteria bacterium]|jgi:hypothetical protein|nr:hypothetical protein [Pseudomonadota bacterium]
MSSTLPPRIEVPDRVLGRRILTGSLRKTALSVAEAIFFDGQPPPPDRVAWMCDELDEHLSCCGPRAGLVVSASLHAVSAFAPTLVGRRPPFRRLEVQQRVKALQRMEKLPGAALAVLALKSLMCIIYYEHPDGVAFLGADDHCLIDGEPK